MANRESRVRAGKRHGTYLETNEPFGVLVTDMTATLDGEALEFKPKWLAQSPNAPANSIRCRTCALRAMRASTLPSTAFSASRPGLPDTSAPVTPFPRPRGWCPLRLLSKRSNVESTIEDIMRQRHHQLSAQAKERAVKWLYENTLLQRLKELQTQMDPCGVLGGEIGEELLIAMALRDCTLFLKVSLLGEKQFAVSLFRSI